MDIYEGGRPVLPLRYVINLFKGFTFIWILSLMHFTGNKSAGMYLYLFLHGTYGLCWLTKDIIYPDATFKRSASVGSLIVLTLFLTGYWAIPIPLALGYGRNNPSLFRIISLVVLYVSGVILMMCSDYQKTIQLQKKKGLISNGFFSLTRNPNYLGEIMIYSSFALCADHLFGYLYVWIIASTLFATNVYLKDKLSYSKK